MMKKVLAICLATLLGMTRLDAQAFSENVRPWNQGQLTWNDFSKQHARAGMRSELKYFLGYDTERRKIKDTIFSRIIVKVYVDRDSSWVDPSFMNPWELRYEQVVFDILENRCRDLQPEADHCRKSTELDSCLQKGFDRAAEDIRLFQTASRYGQDTAVIVQWEDRMQQALNRPDRRDEIPACSRAFFGMGADLGFGSNLYVGNISSRFLPKANVNLGFEIAFGRSELLLNATLGGCKVKTDSFFVNKERWSRKDHLEFCQLNVAYGFRIVDRKTWQLMPFVGYGLTEISTIAGQNDEIKHRERTNGFLGGFCVDYRLRMSLNITPNYLRSKECTDVSLRAKVYVAQVDFNDGLQGMTVNLSLGISVFDQFVKLK